MIELSGLRRYFSDAETVRLEADINFVDVNVKAPAETLWFEIDASYGGMLVDDTYDPFVLVALWQAMFNKTDLKIHGNVSKKLFKNLTWYAQKILCDFSSDLAPVKIFVDGFTTTETRGSLIGTGISCGVDSFSTIYDRFVCEDDPDYKINALFFFNCGSHGDFGSSDTEKVFKSRAIRSAAVAKELLLPLVVVDTNLHVFRNEDDRGNVLFLAFYSCALALQNAIRRYYIPSGYGYNEIKRNGVTSKHYDLAGFGESFFVPLIQTERTELIVDGCQYRRVDKIKKLADWEIARKYLNVCLKQRGDDSTNCGRCSKCLRTLLPLEILGKLDAFAEIFDIEHYKTESMNYKVHTLIHADEDVFLQEQVELAAENNFPMPKRCDCYVLDSNFMVVNNE